MNIYGASGHGKVVIDLVHSKMLEIHQILDDNPTINSVYNYPVVHVFTPEVLDRKTIVAIGDNLTRKKVVDNFSGAFFCGLGHAASVVDSTVELGEGTVIMANATVNAGTKIGSHCILNTGCIVEHDCLLGNFVHISPGAVLAGGVEVGEGSHLGIGALIIPGKKIGKWCTIGAGAVIIEDVPDFATVVGNPGKITRIEDKKHE